MNATICEGCHYPLEQLCAEVAACRNPGCTLNPYLDANAKRVIAERDARLEREAADLRLRQAGYAQSFKR